MPPTLRRTLGASLLALASLATLPGRNTHAANEVVSVVMTTSDRTRLLASQASVAFAPDGASHPVTIDVDEATRFQTMDGFGASLTDSSAWLIWNRMSAAQRSDAAGPALQPRRAGIGLSVLRQPMGASDFSLEHYSYDDTCCDLNDFSIDYELPYIVPLLKQIRPINPELLHHGLALERAGLDEDERLR